MAHKRVGLVILSELEQGVVEEVVGRVSRSLETEVSVSKNLRCDGGFDAARRQWLANAVIELCVKPYASPDRHALGLTDRDLYVPRLNFAFGLASREAGVAVVSWHRLAGEDAFLSTRIVKEVVHEVGHLEGLDHCPKEDCVMWFSNSLFETDRKKADFCPRCRVRRGEQS
ncbi:MAG: archaemetzincin family Zn-dependent metalloprotease [Nitrososphaerales archaeon]|jgi:archaemetzincin